MAVCFRQPCVAEKNPTGWRISASSSTEATVTAEYPIAKAWRDTRLMSIFAGTNEIMKTIAAKFMGL